MNTDTDTGTYDMDTHTETDIDMDKELEYFFPDLYSALVPIGCADYLWCIIAQVPTRGGQSYFKK